jgi:hypothetical protein
MMHFIHRQLYLTLILLALALTACGGPSGAPAPATEPAFPTPLSDQVDVHVDDEVDDHGHVEASDLTGDLQVVVVPTELVVGPERFAVGLFDAEGNMIHDASVHFHYYDLSDPQQAILESEADAYRLQDLEGPTTIYAHERTFERAGDWGVEVEVRRSDEGAARSRIGFRVVADSNSISPGEKAPALRTPTLADVNQDPSRITSALEPNLAFYQYSLDQAIANDKPTLLLFATPAFCQTRFCGPAYETVSDLQAQYGDQFNFIHVEVFTGLPDPAASGFKLAPAVEAFGLESEPWAFLIDEGGIVQYRVEGLFSGEELERQLRAQLSS